MYCVQCLKTSNWVILAFILQFQFLGHSDQYHVPVIVIDDGCQAPVSLATKDRNIIAACFTNFLLSNIGKH